MSGIISSVISFVMKSVLTSIPDDASAEQLRRRRLREHDSIIYVNFVIESDRFIMRKSHVDRDILILASV